MKCNTPASPSTETSIFYTDNYMDRHTDGRTGRVIPVYPQKHLFCRGIINHTFAFAKNTILLQDEETD